jgi:tetratricopeptide (TPR) repeat protein
MGRSPSLWPIWAFVLGAFFFATFPVRAQDAEAAADNAAGSATEPGSKPSTAAYDEAIGRALSAYDSGRYAEARTWFRRAHELQPGARTLRTIGMCSFNLGDYADALQNLEAALTETRGRLKDNQRAHVAELVAQSDRKLGRFKVRLSPEDATLWVDGRQAQHSANGELLLEPGRHEISAQAPHHRAGLSTLQVEGGDRATLEIRLDPLPPGELEGSRAPGPALAAGSELGAPDSRAAASAPRRGSPGSPDSRDSQGIQPVLGYVALGLAGASLITFAVTTGLATAEQAELADHCPLDACPPAYHDEVDAYDRLKLVSTISLVGTAGFAALGVLLLVTAPDAARSERAQLEPTIGLGSIGVRGQL